MRWFGKKHVRRHEWIVAMSRPIQTGTDRPDWQVWSVHEKTYRFKIIAVLMAWLHRWRTGGNTFLRERIEYGK